MQLGTGTFRGPNFFLVAPFFPPTEQEIWFRPLKPDSFGFKTARSIPNKDFGRVKLSGRLRDMAKEAKTGLFRP